MNSKKKNIIEKIVIIGLALVVLGLLVLFLKDIFFPFIKMEINQDFDGAKALLNEKGFLGYTTVSLVEALQMVVIFIPAEFIQISSGMSYPWYLALLLCDLGVVLGASIIYFIVHVFKFDGDIFKKGHKIQKFDKNNNTTKGIMILMYFLFIMPIIPFGAICYYASNKKIKYRYYILTVATGVIPSIITSIIMGSAVKEFIANALPIWLLILIIFGAASILFILILFILNKFYFKQNDGTPDSVFYNLLTKFFNLKAGKKIKIQYSGKIDELKELKGSYLMLANHSSFIDYHYITNIEEERRYAYVFNRFYFGIKGIKWLAKRVGFIPKRIFASDIDTIKQSFKMRNLNYPIMMFPEGRLSPDGKIQSINPSVAHYAKKLNVPLVITRIDNAYLLNPKWRKKIYKGIVNVEIKEILSTDEVNNMDNDKLHQFIVNNLSYNTFDNPYMNTFKQKNKALGLENLLYMCPHCKSLYSNISVGNNLKCQCCNREYHINEKYLFDDNDIPNLQVYYQKIREIEKDNISGLNISIEVDLIIFGKDKNNKKKDSGIFTLNENGLSFVSSKTGYEILMTKEELEGIAYSVNEEFEFYYNNQLHYFYPKKDRAICTRISLLYELLKEN